MHPCPQCIGINRPESSAWSRISSSSPLESPVKSMTSLGAWFSLSSPVTSTAVDTAGSILEKTSSEESRKTTPTQQKQQTPRYRHPRSNPISLTIKLVRKNEIVPISLDNGTAYQACCPSLLVGWPLRPPRPGCDLRPYPR